MRYFLILLLLTLSAAALPILTIIGVLLLASCIVLEKLGIIQRPSREMVRQHWGEH